MALPPKTSYWKLLRNAFDYDLGSGSSYERLQEIRNAPHYMMSSGGGTQLRHGLGLLLVHQIVQAHGGVYALTMGRREDFWWKLRFRYLGPVQSFFLIKAEGIVQLQGIHKLSGTGDFSIKLYGAHACGTRQKRNFRFFPFGRFILQLQHFCFGRTAGYLHNRRFAFCKDVPDKPFPGFLCLPFAAAEGEIFSHISQLQHKSAPQGEPQEPGAEAAHGQNGMAKGTASTLTGKFAAGELKPGPVKASSPMLIGITITELGNDVI